MRFVFRIMNMSLAAFSRLSPSPFYSSLTQQNTSHAHILNIFTHLNINTLERLKI